MCNITVKKGKKWLDFLSREFCFLFEVVYLSEADMKYYIVDDLAKGLQ